MATLTEHNLSILTDWLTHKPQIIQATRGSPDYQRFRPTYVIDDAVNPPLIVRPPSAADVAGLVALMTTHSVPFTIRGGGHDLFHRCMANDAVVVDLRDIAHVHVNPESQSARIGGGVLVREVAAQLAKENLATACSVIPTVGYVGWAIHGGYGLLSSLYGLGADQILGAKVVNASGELIEADDLLLKGLRGAGGTLGVVVELTIRVYPLEKVFGGVVLYQSDDLDSTMRQYNHGYRSLSAGGIPSALGTYQAVISSPSGKAFTVFFLWASSDVASGETWLKKICSLAPFASHTVATTTFPEFLDMAGTNVPDRCHATMVSLNIRGITPAVASVLSTHAMKIPPTSLSLFGVHGLCGPATEGRHRDSVFPIRQPHCMLEIFISADSQDRLAGAYQVVRDFCQAAADADPENLLPGKYLPFAPPGMSAREVFGEQYQALADLKQMYDPQNVFRSALPRM